jgi:hypothetical protein
VSEAITLALAALARKHGLDFPTPMHHTDRIGSNDKEDDNG